MYKTTQQVKDSISEQIKKNGLELSLDYASNSQYLLIDGLGHFGDDARVRIYFCLKTHKLRLCYKENEKYEKRFEKNLDK